MAWVVGIGFALLLLFMFPRQILSLIGILAAIAALVAGYFWLQNLHDQRVSNAVHLNAKYDTSRCSDPKYPILVSFQNDSRKVITKVWFSIAGFVPGHSDSTISNRYLSSDRILDVGDRYESCWAYSSYTENVIFPPSLRWDIEDVRVTYR